jgi:hypothetical protein
MAVIQEDATLAIASSDAVTEMLGSSGAALLMVEVGDLTDSPGAEHRGADVLLW